MEKHTIVGVHVTNRAVKASRVQEVFTDFGCHIKTRLGLHEVTDDLCGPNGLILLELHGPDEILAEMLRALAAIEGVQVQKMVFTHPS